MFSNWCLIRAASPIPLYSAVSSNACSAELPSEGGKLKCALLLKIWDEKPQTIFLEVRSPAADETILEMGLEPTISSLGGRRLIH